MKWFTLVVIARPTPEEVEFLNLYLYSKANISPLIVVTNENYEPGLDGRICRKKNIGVSRVESEYCLVCHADTVPSEQFWYALQSIEVGGDVICPRGITLDGGTGLTWAQTGKYNPSPIYVPGESYISGAAIFGKTEIFKKYPWDESLTWGQGEDIAYSRTLESMGVSQRYEPELVVTMRNPQ